MVDLALASRVPRCKSILASFVHARSNVFIYAMCSCPCVLAVVNECGIVCMSCPPLPLTCDTTFLQDGAVLTEGKNLHVPADKEIMMADIMRPKVNCQCSRPEGLIKLPSITRSSTCVKERKCTPQPSKAGSKTDPSSQKSSCSAANPAGQEDQA